MEMLGLEFWKIPGTKRNEPFTECMSEMFRFFKKHQSFAGPTGITCDDLIFTTFWQCVSDAEEGKYMLSLDMTLRIDKDRGMK
jgi:hypothetical protein